MRKAKVTVKGISPLIMREHAPDLKYSDPPEQWLESRAYRDSKGYLCVPLHAFKRALLVGSIYSFKRVKPKVSSVELYRAIEIKGTHYRGCPPEDNLTIRPHRRKYEIYKAPPLMV